MLEALILAILALTTVPGHKQHKQIATKYAKLILSVSDKEKEDPFLVVAIISRESDFNPNAVNEKTGALGWMQVLPGSADHVLLGWKKAKKRSVLPAVVLDPKINLRVGIRILQRFKLLCEGNLEHALTAYSGDGCADSKYAKEVLWRYEWAKSFWKPAT